MLFLMILFWGASLAVLAISGFFVVFAWRVFVKEFKDGSNGDLLASIIFALVVSLVWVAFAGFVAQAGSWIHGWGL